MKAKSTLLTCILAIVVFSNSAAQLMSQKNAAGLVASFTADYTAGCSPLTVNFKDTSTGTGTFTYSWDLGNGNTSSLPDPKAAYTTPGTYIVKLTVSNGTESNSTQKSIVVYKNPVADFKANAQGCVPFDAKFTDASTKGDATIKNWNWDFRNGILSTETNPEINYSYSGKYDVFLEVTDENGCKASTEKKGFIDVVDEPIVSFVATPSTSCNIPVTVKFTNQSTGAGTLTYAWDFGNNVTSDKMTPDPQTYTKFGTYNVKLKVTSSYGCFTNIDVPAVTIGEVKAIGSIKQGNNTILNNSIVCAGDIDYKNLSIGNADCSWDFGDGSFSYSPEGTHTYSSAGKYVIKLITAPGDICADTVLWNITVEKAVADFSLSPEKSCSSSTLVTFTNKSSDNILKYKWEFHDGSSLTDKDVSKTFVQPVDKDPYVIHEVSTYPVKLVVTSTNGCKDSLERYVEVQEPTALITTSQTKGCAPLTVNFDDYSISALDPIKNKEWQFGDGNTEKTVNSTISHVFNTPGKYQVKMLVTTETGCQDYSPTIYIQVGEHVAPDFTVGNATICPSDKIELFALPISGVTSWHYSINGISVPSCPDIADPLVYMKLPLGPSDVKLQVEKDGCWSEILKEDAITNSGPAGSFDFEINCSSDRTVKLTATSSSSDFKWEFGDGNTNTSDLNLDYTYSSENDFTIKFISYKGACSDTFIRVVKIRNHHPEFSLQAEACAGIVVNMSYSGTDMFNGCGDKYLWDFGDNSQMIRTRNATVGHAFVDGGTYKIKLTTFFDDGCSGTKENAIRIYKPVPKFSVDKDQGCAPLNVTFTDESTPDVKPLKTWSWDFYDGNNPLTYSSKIPTLNNTFGSPGEYNVSLTVTDDFGCSAVYEKPISTANPSALFTPVSLAEICAGDEVEFLMDYPDPDKAVWNFGDGHTEESIEKPVKHVYKENGDFDVTLTLYKYGCSDEFSINKCVRVQKADAKFTASDTAYNCYPRMINFKHSAGNNIIESGKWYYGHGNNSSASYLDATSYNYTEPGKYTVKLEIKTSFGCSDSYSKVIKITGPTGNFSVSPKEACQGDEITYVLSDTANVHSFDWDLGDGNFAVGNPVKHRYTSVGNKTAKLILYGDKGNCIPPAIEENVHIFEVVSGISVADTSVCEGTTIEFKNTSQGANTYKWDFGDEAGATSTETSHLFKPGIYKVSLMTEGIHGCKDTAVQYVVISKIPTLTVSNDTTICAGGKALLKATSDKDIRWEPGTYLNSASISNPVSDATQDINYVVFATDPLSQCFKKDSVFITVQQKPEVELAFRDTGYLATEPIDINSEIVAGRTIRVTALASEDNCTFIWSPAEAVSCSTCYNPVIKLVSNLDYALIVTDKNKCFTLNKDFTIKVKDPEKKFDVPTAFTPDGDIEVNKIFRINDNQVKQLLEFKIYNRWGNIVFSSTDLSKGWDGTYQGKAQPMDSYIYTIKIETFEGKVETKTGTVLLLR